MTQFEAVVAAYQGFTDLFQSVILSTASAEGTPNASYSPFVKDESNNIYIYVSGLATHTQNLHATNKASVMFIEDEAQTKQILARRRLIFDCTATLIERETDLWNQTVQHFEERFGNVIQMMRELPDFRIFKFTPTSGRFVIGFGAIYTVDPNNLNSLIPITS
jgi:hypothetical protein